jgi:hypothetical protein
MGQAASVSKDAIVQAAKTKANYLPPLGPPNPVRDDQAPGCGVCSSTTISANIPQQQPFRARGWRIGRACCSQSFAVSFKTLADSAQPRQLQEDYSSSSRTSSSVTRLTLVQDAKALLTQQPAVATLHKSALKLCCSMGYVTHQHI